MTELVKQISALRSDSEALVLCRWEGRSSSLMQRMDTNEFRLPFHIPVLLFEKRGSVNGVAGTYLLQRVVPCMAILTIPRGKVKVSISNEFFVGIINVPGRIRLDVLVPDQ